MDEVGVNRFCSQYLQLERDLDFPSGQVLREAHVQDALHRRLFADDALAHPPPARYQLRVLKELVSRIETSIEDWDEHEVSDDLMTHLSELLASPLPEELIAVQQKAYVTYSQTLLSGDSTPATGLYPHVTLLESRQLISAGGTTGLRTWEAALHLGQYLCANPSLVQNKRVLELGAGTGYVAILCAKHLGPSQVIASDGSDDVVANLPESFYVNGLQDSRAISAMDLKWGQAIVGTEEAEWNGGQPLDLVLGADVTYDESVIPSLVGTIDDLFDMFPRVLVIISATERNRRTFDAFINVCQKRGLNIQEVDFDIAPRDKQTGPFYSDQVPIRICRITRGQ
ncbi:Protein-lysine N-methyltransferase EFM3 [Apiospora marii]|uniref:Protein-lysine N-methyltransferase EFM3 n=1 Tax=Apiospora marii TaxID=335849 RepID=UPI00313100B3